MLSEMSGAAQSLIDKGVEYIDIRTVETQTDGYSREIRLIVENKTEEGEHERPSHTDKVRHPANANP
jgi:hypothetical protein